MTSNTLLKMTLNSFIKFGVIPLLTLVVVASHFYFVHHGLSNWKGGGFGMYTTYNPSQAQLYIDGVEFKGNLGKDEVKNYAVNYYLFYPTVPNFTKIVETIKNPKDTMNVEIWYPNVNAENSTFSRQLVHEYKYVKPN